jgi:hypothetical protein
MTEASGRRGKPGGGAHQSLASIAIDSIARHGREIADRGRTVLPLREEAGDDVVAHRKLGYPFAEGLHYAGAIRHRNKPVRRLDLPGHDEVVVKVEGTRVQPDPDLARRRLAGVGHLDQFQPVESARRAEYDPFHSRPLLVRAAN